MKASKASWRTPSKTNKGTGETSHQSLSSTSKELTHFHHFTTALHFTPQNNAIRVSKSPPILPPFPFSLSVTPTHTHTHSLSRCNCNGDGGRETRNPNHQSLETRWWWWWWWEFTEEARVELESKGSHCFGRFQHRVAASSLLRSSRLGRPHRYLQQCPQKAPGFVDLKSNNNYSISFFFFVIVLFCLLPVKWFFVSESEKWRACNLISDLN